MECGLPVADQSYAVNAERANPRQCPAEGGLVHQASRSLAYRARTIDTAEIAVIGEFKGNNQGASRRAGESGKLASQEMARRDSPAEHEGAYPAIGAKTVQDAGKAIGVVEPWLVGMCPTCANASVLAFDPPQNQGRCPFLGNVPRQLDRFCASPGSRGDGRCDRAACGGPADTSLGRECKKRAFRFSPPPRLLKSTILRLSWTTSPSQAGLVRFPGQARRDRASVIYSWDAAPSSLWNMPITLPSVSRKSANRPMPGMQEFSKVWRAWPRGSAPERRRQCSATVLSAM